MTKCQVVCNATVGQVCKATLQTPGLYKIPSYVACNVAIAAACNYACDHPEECKAAAGKAENVISNTGKAMSVPGATYLMLLGNM
jgi:hypothetical protein